jgi:hypothetical protein
MPREYIKQPKKSGTVRTGDEADVNLDEGRTTPDLASATGEDDAEQESKQSTINLIAIDSMRVSEFCIFNNFFLGGIFELAISVTFLLKLIGWKALLAGLTAFALTAPLNIYMTKKYSTAQNALMRIRDEKMVVVTEAVRGMRQIKLSALEEQWQAKIRQVRNRELDEQW